MNDRWPFRDPFGYPRSPRRPLRRVIPVQHSPGDEWPDSAPPPSFESDRVLADADARSAAQPLMRSAAAQPAPEAEFTPPPPASLDAEPSKADLRAALRELENARARVERDSGAERVKARRELVEGLLPVLDNLDRSIAAAAGSRESALLDGVRLVRQQFSQVLAGYGLEAIDAVGCRFDPSVHEAVSVIDVDDPELDGAVVEQWAAGYRFADQLVRPARVSVGRVSARAAAAHSLSGSSSR